MYYRDLTRAASIMQREIDLVHTAATSDARSMYLWWMPGSAYDTQGENEGADSAPRQPNAGFIPRR